jgi:hypothetical protein
MVPKILKKQYLMVGLDMVELTQEHRFDRSAMYCIYIYHRTQYSSMIIRSNKLINNNNIMFVMQFFHAFATSMSKLKAVSKQMTFKTQKQVRSNCIKYIYPLNKQYLIFHQKKKKKGFLHQIIWKWSEVWKRKRNTDLIN